MEYVEPDHRRLKVHMNGPSLYVARLQPYRISDLEKLKADIAGDAMVEITTIGHTVEGRELEMIRVGSPDAPHRVLIRARAHPWEPGGNWVLEGLIRRLLRDDDVAQQCLATYCLYVMPMANKDGVARGRTRFNMNGKDLNRDWLQPADPTLGSGKRRARKMARGDDRAGAASRSGHRLPQRCLGQTAFSPLGDRRCSMGRLSDESEAFRRDIASEFVVSRKAVRRGSPRPLPEGCRNDTESPRVFTN